MCLKNIAQLHEIAVAFVTMTDLYTCAGRKGRRPVMPVTKDIKKCTSACQNVPFCQIISDVGSTICVAVCIRRGRVCNTFCRFRDPIRLPGGEMASSREGGRSPQQQLLFLLYLEGKGGPLDA